MKNVFISFIILAFIACSSTQNTVQEETVEETKQTYLALGDSYTIGEMVNEYDRWPVQLVTHLNKSGHQFEQAKIIAKTGWRTDELAKAIKYENIEEQFDLVSLLIGVNNQYQGKSLEEFSREFNSLLKEAISRCKTENKGVFVVSIPNYGVTPFGQTLNPKKITKELIEFNKICKQTCADYGVLFINITDLSEEAKNDISYVAKDKLHPSGRMYNLWIQKRIFPAITELLMLNTK